MHGYVRIEAGCVPRTGVAHSPAESARGLARDAEEAAGKRTAASAATPPATFSLAYQSRDCALSVFQLAQGGLQAVRTARMV